MAGRGLRGDRFFDHQQDFYQASPTDAPVTIPTNVEAELFDQASKQKKQFEELDNFLRTTEVFVEAARYYSKTILPR